MCLVANDGVTGRDYRAASGRVEDFDEGHEHRIEACNEAEVSPDSATVQAADEVAEVACCKKEESDPEQEEDAPHSFAKAEGDDPEKKGKDAPHEKSDGHRGGGRSFKPARADCPLKKGEPPPEETVGGEGDHAEGITGFEFECASDDLGNPTECEGERDDDSCGVRDQNSSVDTTEDDCGEAETCEAEWGGIGRFRRKDRFAWHDGSTPDFRRAGGGPILLRNRELTQKNPSCS